MLLTRVITAVVLLALFVGAVLLGREALGAAMALALSIVLYEWLRMVKSARRAALPAALVCAAAGVAYAVFGSAPKGPLFLGLELAACAVWMSLLGVVFVARDRGFAVSDATSLGLAVLFGPAQDGPGHQP